MSKPIQRFTAGLAAVLALLALPLHAAPIVNGGFEAGFSNWTRVDQIGSDGGFLLQTGATSPINGFPMPHPTEGAFAAVTDAQAGGSHVLYQDFVQVAPVTSAILSFDLFVSNQADDFHVPASLDWATPALNQQARVDILLGGTDPFSLGLGDLLLNVFQTFPGDPLVSGYNHYTVDITSLINANLNTSLRLRFSEVDNVNFFNLGVDNVAIEIDRPTDVPEPGSALLVLAGLGAAALNKRRRLRRQA